MEPPTKAKPKRQTKNQELGTINQMRQLKRNVLIWSYAHGNRQARNHKQGNEHDR
jgi:hypothetical protein